MYSSYRKRDGKATFSASPASPGAPSIKVVGDAVRSDFCGRVTKSNEVQGCRRKRLLQTCSYHSKSIPENTSATEPEDILHRSPTEPEASPRPRTKKRASHRLTRSIPLHQFTSKLTSVSLSNTWILFMSKASLTVCPSLKPERPSTRAMIVWLAKPVMYRNIS